MFSLYKEGIFSEKGLVSLKGKKVAEIDQDLADLELL
jgi:hypothetical protein